MSASFDCDHPLRRDADEANSGLLWHMRLRTDAARTPAERDEARDLRLYRGRLCRWTAPYSLIPVSRAEAERRLAEAVEAIEADPKRFRLDPDAATLLRYWRVWGRRLPEAVAQGALEGAAEWPFPVLEGAL